MEAEDRAQFLLRISSLAGVNEDCNATGSIEPKLRAGAIVGRRVLDYGRVTRTGGENMIVVKLRLLLGGHLDWECFATTRAFGRQPREVSP